MKSKFIIRADAERRLIDVRIEGFLDVAQVHAYVADRIGAIAQLGTPPNAHLSIYDLSDAPLQSQEVMALLQTVVEDRRFASRRLAFILGGSAIGMQVRRIVRGRDAVACFETRDEAEAWLFQPDAAPVGRAA